MLVNTVRGNFKGYTRHDIERAKEARRIQGMIANPTEKKFAGMVRERLLTNCPVTVRDVDNANRIFVPTSLTSGEKRLGQNRSALESNMCRSLGILYNCTSM